MLEVTYSYWDGSGHRKVIKVKKGTSIGKFLEQIKAQLIGEFSALRSVNPDDLMYVKEDLIIPQHLSFYDLIVTKARGKSGPLFHFDVHEDVRIITDVNVEKDESHPGKVVERRWYERNKHIFPASRWELFDPSLSREHVGYTIHGHEVRGQKK
jgi:protein FAM50